jgi:hypothetical protein
MARLWRNVEETKEGKYLVTRRDGTIPDWPNFVLGAADPSTPAALRAYADKAEELGKDPAFVADVRALADEFEDWRLRNGEGDPDAPRHRKDDPFTVAKMRHGKGA